MSRAGEDANSKGLQQRMLWTTQAKVEKRGRGMEMSLTEIRVWQGRVEGKTYLAFLRNCHRRHSGRKVIKSTHLLMKQSHSCIKILQVLGNSTSSELIVASLSEPDATIFTVVGHISVRSTWMSSNHVGLLLRVPSAPFHSRTHLHTQINICSYLHNTVLSGKYVLWKSQCNLY
jgi:hypothetical protein